MSNFGIHSGYFHQTLRDWQESNTQITEKNLMYPVFITSDPNGREAIASMDGIYRWGLHKIEEHLKPIVANGLKSVLIFGVPDPQFKDDVGSSADDPAKSPVIPVVKLIREKFPDLLVACDVCLCAFTSHGHCGILTKDGIIDNEKSIKRLAEVSLNYVRAGCQVIAPSDMMDGRILAIKNALKGANLLNQVSVLSYSAKFASCFYGPFRAAAGSAPSFGNRKSYQLPPGSSGLALKACERDIAEGADFLMVKPALAYLDIIKSVKDQFKNVPLFAYQVSGEYSMIMSGAEQGFFDLDTAIMETLVSLRRAGTDVIISYFTPRILENLSPEKNSNNRNRNY